MFRSIILLSTLLLVAGCASNQSNTQTVASVNTELVRSDVEPAIFSAIEQGDEDEFKKRILSGESINLTYDGLTPFRLALIERKTRFASILLRLGAVPDWNLSTGEKSSLMIASGIGANKIVKRLILAGAELNYTDGDGSNALTEAALNGHLTTVNILLNAGADVNAVSSGQSLLMHLVEQNNMLIVRPLIDAGADVNFIDEFGNTALRIARENEYHELDLMLVHAGARL